MTSILCSKFYGHDWLQTCRYKTRELLDVFVEIREKSVEEFPRYSHVCKKCGFKHIPTSWTTLSLKENK